MDTIRTERAGTLKGKPDPSTVKFGVSFTDHMFLLNYESGKGWYDPRIVPYGPISLEPSAMVFHYAQEIFEGLKAYRRADGRVQLFRPLDNIRRLNASAQRLCIPTLDENLALEALCRLVRLEESWVPSLEGTSLYIRPFIIATDPTVGVHSSHNYLFAVILCPVGSYYPEGINPVKIFVETEDVRAVRGGTGFAKTGGNYAATIRAAERAGKKGFTQVLWLDGVERKYIEEVGTMNVFFKIGGEVVTPPLSGSILAGITRDSCLKLLHSWGIPVSERPITAQELFAAGESGELEEAFGSGTAAVISPIGEMDWDGRRVVVSGGKIGPLAQRLYDTLTGIQWGKVPDPFGWVLPL